MIEQVMIGYTDADYLLDRHKTRSQIEYVFTCDGTAISWRSQKQTLIVTASSHVVVVGPKTHHSSFDDDQLM